MRNRNNRKWIGNTLSLFGGFGRAVQRHEPNGIEHAYQAELIAHAEGPQKAQRIQTTVFEQFVFGNQIQHPHPRKETILIISESRLKEEKAHTVVQGERMSTSEQAQHACHSTAFSMHEHLETQTKHSPHTHPHLEQGIGRPLAHGIGSRELATDPAKEQQHHYQDGSVHDKSIP